MTWKLHQRLDSAEFEARGFDFQLRMASKDPGFNIVVSELSIDIEEVMNAHRRHAGHAGSVHRDRGRS